YRAQSRLGIAPRVSFSQRSSDRAVVLEEQKNYTEDQLAYMRGPQVLGRVEEKMQDFRTDGPPPTKRLMVSKGEGSTFIMTVESPNLEYARQFARVWVQEFLAFKEQMRNEVARRQIDKTRVDISQAEEDVYQAQQRLDAFIRQHKIATSEDTGNAAQQLLVSLQRRQQEVALERQRLEARTAEELADERTAALEVASAMGAAAGGPQQTLIPAELPGSIGQATPPTAVFGGALPSDTADPLDKFLGKSSYRELKLTLARMTAELRRQSEFLKPAHPYMIKLEEARAETERQIGAQLAIIEEMRQARIESLKQEYAV